MNARWLVLGLVLVAGFAVPESSGGAKIGLDPQEIKMLLDKGVKFLEGQQTAEGSFSPKLAGPGISALIVAGLARNGHSGKEPVVAKTLAYLESQVQKDGGIYNKALANYTTSVAVMAFKEANQDGKYDALLQNAAKFLKSLQHEEDVADVRHGGFGYDGKSRPDMSNSAFALEALLAAGLSKDDPAVRKALKFVSRCQNLPGETNDQPFAAKTSDDDQGGLSYTPYPGQENRYTTAAGGLRSLGGMTYGGLKSFLYAGVSKDDPRVKAAIGWVRRHYTLDENPGMGQAGLYYYYHTFGKAMNAWAEDLFEDASGKKHDWRQELFDALKKRQQADGSWRNIGDKTFGEANPDLATAFAILSLSYCKAK